MSPCWVRLGGEEKGEPVDSNTDGSGGSEHFGLCHNHSSLLLWVESSHRQYARRAVYR